LWGEGEDVGLTADDCRHLVRRHLLPGGRVAERRHVRKIPNAPPGLVRYSNDSQIDIDIDWFGTKTAESPSAEPWALPAAPADDAPAAVAESDRQLAELGLTCDGWTRVFDLALLDLSVST